MKDDKRDPQEEPLHTWPQSDPSEQLDGDQTEPMGPYSTIVGNLADTEPATLASDSTASMPGHDLGDYELLEEIARGGMGVVFKARQKRLNRLVALKMILSGNFAGEEEIQRFHAEAEAAANLEHPAIVPIYEVGEFQGHHFFSMGYVEGKSAASLVANGPIESRQAAELLRQITDAIAYAHEHKVIHRDLKPSNILIDPEGKPKVTDFGLAKRVDSDAGLTGTGQVLGTPNYMAPEQAAARLDDVGVGTDVYSLGGILYCFLTGRPTFQAANVMDTLMQVMHEEPISPRRLNGSVDLDLETICLKCLQKDPADRYASANELSDELGRYLNDEPILARPTGSATRVIRWCRRNRPLATAIGCVVVLLLTMAIVGPLVAMKQARLAKTEIGLRKTAEDEKANALKARNEASTARQNAEKNADRALQLSYGAGMSLAQVTRRDGNFKRFQTLLDRNRPIAVGDKDLRSWEWYLLRRLANDQDSPESQLLQGHSRAITDVAFAPNGQTLATGSLDGSVILWDVRDGAPKPIGRLGENLGPVEALAFAPDGRRLAVALQLTKQPAGSSSVPFGRNVVVLMYDVLSGADQSIPLFAWQGFLSGINVMTFSPDGSVLVTADGSAPVEGLIYYWDAATGKQLRLIYANINEIHALEFSPDSTLLAIGGGWGTERGELRLLDAISGKVVRVLGEVTQEVKDVCFSSDGKWLLSGEGDLIGTGFIRKWDVATGELLWTNKDHDRGVSGVAYTPDGERIISASIDQTVRVWDAEGRQQLLAFRNDHSVNSLALSRDGTSLVTGGGSSDQTELRFWDASPVSEPLQGRGHLETIVQTSFIEPDNGDKPMLVSLSRDQSLRFWDVDSGLQLNEIPSAAGFPIGFSFDTLNRRLLTVGSPAGNVEMRLWDLESKQEVKLGQLEGTKMVTHVTASRDGQHVAIAETGPLLLAGPAKLRKKRILRVDPATLETEEIWETTDLILSVEMSPNGKFLAVATGAPIENMNEPKNGLQLLDMDTKQSVWSRTDLPYSVGSVSFSRDGSQLAYAALATLDPFSSSQTEATVILVDVASGLDRELEGIMGSPVQFVGPDSLLAIGTDGEGVMLWDLKQQAEVGRLPDVKGLAQPMSWTADGKRFAWIDHRAQFALSGLSVADSSLNVRFGQMPFDQPSLTIEPWPRTTPRSRQDSPKEIQDRSHDDIAGLPGPSAETITERHARAELYRKPERQLTTISSGFQSYRSGHRGQLPQNILDEDGKPLLSWRVALLPDIGEQELYDEFHLDEPWDSPHNHTLLAKIPPTYQSEADASTTPWQRLVGSGAFWSPEIDGNYRKVRDGTAYTLSMVGIAPGVPWTQPIDLEFENPQEAVEQLTNDSEGTGFHALLGDAAAKYFQSDMPAETVKALITAAGGEAIDPDLLSQHEGWSQNQLRWVEFGPARMSGQLLIPVPALPEIPADENALAVKLRQAPKPPLPDEIEQSFKGAVTAQRRMMFSSGLKNTIISIRSYDDVNRRLPKNITDKQGNPLLSWRVAILPFLDEMELYERFHRDEPWDSPHNLELLSEMPRSYSIGAAEGIDYGAQLVSPPRGDQTPEPKGEGLTHLQGVVNAGAAFASADSGRQRSLKEFDNKIVLIEAANPVPWTKPTDLAFEDLESESALDQIGSGEFDDYYHAVLGNGSVRANSKSQLTLKQLREWLIAE